MKKANYAGENPLGEQLCQFMAKDLGKDNETKATYKRIAIEQMTELCKRIAGGEVKPEDAKAEKLKLKHPSNWQRGTKRSHATASTAETSKTGNAKAKAKTKSKAKEEKKTNTKKGAATDEDLEDGDDEGEVEEESDAKETSSWERWPSDSD